MPRPARLALVVGAVLFALAARPVRAGDGPPAPAPAAAGASSGRVDLSDLRAGPAVVGPRLYAPSDASFPGFDTPEAPADAYVTKFQEPPFPLHVASPDLVEDLVRRFVPEAGEGAGSARLSGDALEVWASAEGLARARAVASFASAWLAPRLRVAATLTSGGARLEAAGGVALPPRRWTPVWFRREQRRTVVAFEPEIASEAVSNRPTITALPEGTELYLRWSPGETVSLVEVWFGSVEQVGELEVDLSGIRNVPEANSMGTARLPRAALRRVVAVVAVPGAKPSQADFTWEGAGTPLALRLAFAAETAPESRSIQAPAGAFAVLRIGALAAPLDGGLRPARVDEAIRRLQALEAAGGAEGRGPETFAQTFVGSEGPPARAARWRDDLAAQEERLAGAVLEVRAVAVAEPALRERLANGRLVVGRPVEADGGVPEGARTVAAVRTTLASGIAGSVRAGASVTGYAHLPVEIAERTGALFPSPVGRFDGLAASVRATRRDDGSWGLAFDGDLTWVRPAGAKAELAFRSPVGMGFRNYNSGPEDPTVRRVEVPLLTEGEGAVETSVAFSAADVAAGKAVLLAVLSRPAEGGGTEPVLLLATLRR